MSLSAGIVGLPNVGKSTLFNAITNSQIEAANYPFATIEPNVGMVKLEDERIDFLSKIMQPKKTTYSYFQFVDIAGLVKGASKGEGLGNQFLSNIRNVDAIIHVIRCFDDKKIEHVFSDINPLRDVEIINLELAMADYSVLEKRVGKLKSKIINSKNSLLKEEFDLCKKIMQLIEQEKSILKHSWTEKELQILKDFNLLTFKPMILVGNIEEKHLLNPLESIHFQNLNNYAKKNHLDILPISSQIEAEISQIESGEDKREFFESIGLKETGLATLTRATFKLLNLSTFFTIGKDEVRAWTFTNGENASECAGKIHSDIQKGFIRAEIIKYEDFFLYKNEQKIKEKGKMFLEGKNYLVKEGDICHFRFAI